jgi:hypothetical protein
MNWNSLVVVVMIHIGCGRSELCVTSFRVFRVHALFTAAGLDSHSYTADQFQFRLLILGPILRYVLHPIRCSEGRLPNLSKFRPSFQS